MERVFSGVVVGREEMAMDRKANGTTSAKSDKDKMKDME